MKNPSVSTSAKSIPVYYQGQNAQGVPDHYKSVEEARRLRAEGKARSINRGEALLVMGPRRTPQSHRESTKSRWKVVGQTPKDCSYPGFPRYASV